MEVYLVRHTETIAPKGVCYGQYDINLKKPFLNQFEDILSKLNLQNAIIYSSPLSRCAQLAEFINHNSHNTQNVTYDHRLKELNFGQWEMVAWDDIPKESLNIWMDDFTAQVVPDGESFTQLHERVCHFIANILKPNKLQQPVIIVTHAGVIRSFLCYSQEVFLKDAFTIEPVEFGGIYKIEI